MAIRHWGFSSKSDTVPPWPTDFTCLSLFLLKTKSSLCILLSSALKIFDSSNHYSSWRHVTVWALTLRQMKVCRMQNPSIKKANQEKTRGLACGFGCSLRTLVLWGTIWFSCHFQSPKNHRLPELESTQSHPLILQLRRGSEKLSSLVKVIQQDMRARTKHQPFW